MNAMFSRTCRPALRFLHWDRTTRSGACEKETFLIDCKLFPKEESLSETEYNLDTGLAALGSAL